MNVRERWWPDFVASSRYRSPKDFASYKYNPPMDSRLVENLKLPGVMCGLVPRYVTTNYSGVCGVELKVRFLVMLVLGSAA